MKITKKEFVIAHDWMFGCGKKHAENEWKLMKESGLFEYAERVIESYRQNSYKAFYND